MSSASCDCSTVISYISLPLSSSFSDVEKDSLPRSDSEEETPELSVVELPAAAAKPGTTSGPSYRRRQLHLQHSLYSGPRPQHQHRNHQRSRQLCGPLLTMSALSPPRIVPINPMAGGDDDADSNQSISQSLYAPPSALSPCSSESSSSSGGSSTGHGSVVLMEESWYVTPPPCFTSIGPINMEASPFENLLIEHPRLVIFVLHTYTRFSLLPHATAKHHTAYT